MAHFAKIEANGNRVLTVLTVTNKDVLNSDGVEEESVGQQYLEKHHNWPANKWIQTSYNTFAGKHYKPNSAFEEDDGTPLRKNFAGIGFTYDSGRDAFIPPKPYASWTLNEETCQWVAPISCSGNELDYVWYEDSRAWLGPYKEDNSL